MQQTPIAVGQNFLAGLTGGMQAGQQIKQANDQNTLRNIFATQDINDPAVQQQIMGLDPQTGMALQNQTYQREQDTYQRGRQVKADARADETFKMRADEYARGLSADEAAQTAARVEQGLMAAIPLVESGNLDGLNQLFTQYGIDPVTSVEQATAALGQYQTVLGALKGVRDLNAGPKAADEYGRYAQEETAAGRTPLSRIDYKKAGQKTTRTTVGPDGSVVIDEDFGGNSAPKMTVDAAKNTGFYIRTKESNQILDALEDQGTRFGQQSLDAVPLGIGNYARDEEFQKFDQARRDFVNAILRRESGAVISDQEFENANKQYFPVPGDGPEVIAQKRRNRQTAIEGLRVGAGEGAGYVDGQSGRDPEVTPFNPETPDFSQMSDEQLQAYIDGGGK